MSLQHLEREGGNPILSQVRWYRRPDKNTLIATNPAEIRILNISLPPQDYNYSYSSEGGQTELFSNDSRIVDAAEDALIAVGKTKED